jgi:hypothetical protein
MDQAHRLLTEKLFVLSVEDRNRMSRLYEEVRTRLEEMVMIGARTLRLTIECRSDAEFTLPFVEGEPEFGAVAIVRISRGYLCYDYSQGVCFEFEEPDARSLAINKD